MSTIGIIIALILLGLVLLAVEILTPMFGVLAAMGIVALIGSIIAMHTLSPAGALALALAELVIVPIYAAVLVRKLPRTALGRRLFLAAAEKADGEGTPDADEYKAIVGRKGVAMTDLRPSGAVDIGGKRMIASAESGMIDKDEPVRVVRANGMNLVVRRDGKS